MTGKFGSPLAGQFLQKVFDPYYLKTDRLIDLAYSLFVCGKKQRVVLFVRNYCDFIGNKQINWITWKLEILPLRYLLLLTKEIFTTSSTVHL